MIPQDMFRDTSNIGTAFGLIGQGMQIESIIPRWKENSHLHPQARSDMLNTSLCLCETPINP